MTNSSLHLNFKVLAMLSAYFNAFVCFCVNHLCDVQKYSTEHVINTMTINAIVMTTTPHPHPVPLTALYNVRAGQADVIVFTVVIVEVDLTDLCPLPVQGGSGLGM